MSFRQLVKKAKVDHSDMKEIKGHYDEIKDWRYDKSGYFLIRVNKEKKRVEIGHCKKVNKLTMMITGKKPQDLYAEAIKRKLVSRLDHAAYLGKELEKAFLALKYDLKYVQGKKLKLK